jgi:hypothetical protein
MLKEMCNTKEDGKMSLNMVMEFKKERTVIDIRGCGMQARFMDTENVTMLRVISMKVNG